MVSIRRVIGLASVLFVLSACGGGSSSSGDSGGQTPPPSTQTYSVGTSVTGSGSGSISPTSQTVSQGSTTSFTISPATGSTITSVTGCGGSLSGTSYTTGAITGSCTVTATFDLTTHNVTTAAGTGGRISPTSATVTHGSRYSFGILPDSGYEISSVSGCGGSLSGNTYTTGPVTAACTISADFNQTSTTPPTTYTVSTTIAGTGSGTISPASASVNEGQTANFTVSAALGSETESVTGCAGSLNGTTYTTGPVTGNCNIVASFQETGPPPTTSSLTLAGHVVGAGVPDVDVLAKVGSEEFHARTDADGYFTLSLSSDDPDAMIALYASTPQRPLLDLFSILGTVSELTLQAGPESVLTADRNHSVNITVFTTARAVLAERVLERSVSSDEDIDIAISSMWVEELVELAAAAWLVLEKNAPLPSGVAGIRQLLEDQDAIEEFKTSSVSPEEFEDAKFTVVDPAQEPRMLPRLTAELVPDGYVPLLPTMPGTLPALAVYALESFARDGTGFRYYPDPERQYRFDWLNTATGQLRIVPRDAAIEGFGSASCWDGGAWQEYNLQDEVIERNYQLLYIGRRADQLNVLTRWRRSLVGELPPGCSVDLPFLWNGASVRLAPKIGDGELEFRESDFPSTRVLMDVGRPIAAEAFSKAVGLFYLEPGGTGFRLRWEPGEPLESDTTPLIWSLDRGRISVSIAGEESVRYFRLSHDGRGGEGLAYVAETSEGVIGGYANSAVFSPAAQLSTRLEFLGEWKGGAYLSALPQADRSPFDIRLCNDQAPIEENTGPLYGTGTMTDHGPLSWDMRPENGELLMRIYYDQATQTYLPFCEEATPPEAGSCRLYQQREWLPVARDGNRLYIIERLEIRWSVVDPQRSDYLGIRMNFYENFGCTP